MMDLPVLIERLKLMSEASAGPEQKEILSEASLTIEELSALKVELFKIKDLIMQKKTV